MRFLLKSQLVRRAKDCKLLEFHQTKIIQPKTTKNNQKQQQLKERKKERDIQTTRATTMSTQKHIA